MPALPPSAALTTIPDGSLAVAADLRSNFSSLQSPVNSLITIFGGGTAGQVLTSSGGAAVAWAAPATTTIYRKTTAKDVNTTVAETDLLNGEITVGAGALGTTGKLRLHASGDFLNNTGGALATPQIKLKLGGTVVIDSGAAAGTLVNSATRRPWTVEAEITNLGVANSQTGWIRMFFGAAAALTDGIGGYSAALATPFAQALFAGTNGTKAVDTTVGCALVLSVINASGLATYSMRLLEAQAEVI